MSIGNELSNIVITCNEKRDVDLNALNLLASGTLNHFCSCSYKNEKKHHLFIYDTDDRFSLSQLQAGLSFENAVDIFASALSMIDEIYTHNLMLDSVKNAKEYIFGENGHYQFIYIPLMHKSHLKAKDFLLKLFSVVHYKDERLSQAYKGLRKQKSDQEALAYMQGFVASYMTTGGVSSLLNQDEGTTLLGQDEGTALMGQDEGTTLLNQDEGTTLLNQDEGTTLLNQDEGTTLLNQDEGTTLLSQDEGTTLLSQDENLPMSAPAEGETTVLSLADYEMERSYTAQPTSDNLTAYYHNESSEYETTVLSEQPAVVGAVSVNQEIQSTQNLNLIRIANGETIAVDVTPFTIGKDSVNMDCVLFNDSISRHHATIIYEDGEYYIVDNHSTNGTIIEGVRLQPGERCEIGNGYILSLGSESFQTHIERRV